MIKKILVISLMGLCLILPFGNPAFASFVNIVSVGDSLTDNGTSATDSYGIMRFTDSSQVWVEKLASYLGADLFDVAYGGATTGYYNPAYAQDAYNTVYNKTGDAAYATAVSNQALNTGVLSQVEGIVPNLSLFSTSWSPDTTLFTIWAGANDFLQYLSGNSGYSSYSDPSLAVGNIITALNDLTGMGATNILIPNLPNIGNTPDFYSGPDSTYSAIASGWTLLFNTDLSGALTSWSANHTNVNLFNMDVYSLFQNYTPGTPQWASMFWTDDFHPSAEGHQQLFIAAASAIGDPVPEPTTILLFGIGLLGLVAMKRKKFNL